MPDDKSIYKILKKAIRFNKFEFKFRPIYNNEKKMFTKAELEIGVNDAKFGFIGSDLFYSVAEEHGLMCEIRLLVIEKACEYIEMLNKDNIDFEGIIISISTTQLDEKKVEYNLEKVLEKYEIDPTKLIIEIKEKECENGIGKINDITNIIKTISNRGIKVSINNSGRVHIPLSRMISNELEYIRIAKCIMLDAEDNEKARIILKHIIALGKELGVKVIVEGVEKEEHEDMLKKFGGKYMQGSYLSEEIDFTGLEAYFKGLKV